MAKSSRTKPIKRTLPRATNNNYKHKLFNKNRPKEIDTAIVDTSNSFCLLTEELEWTSDVKNHTVVTKPKKISKPPPIILYGIEDVKQLTNFILEAVKKEDYSYKIISRNP